MGNNVNAPWRSSKAHGVIDIGSNSTRMVIFDSQTRSPEVLFNERVLTLLGSEMQSTGRLHEAGVKVALAALARFRVVAEHYDVMRLEPVATAAVRDAEDGPDFVKIASDILGAPLEVLPGDEEARLSAMGVIAGVPGANGLMGDLGGGSLELVRLDKGAVGEAVSYKLGALRLLERCGENAQKIRKTIKKHLEDADIAKSAKGGTLYAVGGLWRNVARLHMEDRNYPMRMLHGYSIPADQITDLALRVTGEKGTKPRALTAMARRRTENMFAGIAALDALIDVSGVKNIMISAYGLREGVLFDRLAQKERDRDPLIAAVEGMAARMARTVLDSHELDPWLGQLFELSSFLKINATGQSETYWERLRTVAGILGDFGWRFDSETRGRDAGNMILTSSLPAIDHIGRAFLALSLWYRYTSQVPVEHVAQAVTLLDPDMRAHARQLGVGLRLAFTITGGAPGLLPHCKLDWQDKTLRLTLCGPARDLESPEVHKVMERLGDAFDCEVLMRVK